jgi:paired amphipathic helix protein Sin3a
MNHYSINEEDGAPEPPRDPPYNGLPNNIPPKGEDDVVMEDVAASSADTPVMMQAAAPNLIPVAQEPRPNDADASNAPSLPYASVDRTMPPAAVPPPDAAAGPQFQDALRRSLPPLSTPTGGTMMQDAAPHMSWSPGGVPNHPQPSYSDAAPERVEQEPRPMPSVEQYERPLILPKPEVHAPSEETHNAYANASAGGGLAPSGINAFLGGPNAPPPEIYPRPPDDGMARYAPESQPGSEPPNAGGGGMRELRVEDALLYLDDVKREFKDRPAIYNEFLAIMKNFKSQEVDTPGVIDRVSKLFRGYNNLILGFNTFLPDGCKISLADLERAEALRVAEEQAAHLQAQVYAKAKKSPMPQEHLPVGGKQLKVPRGPKPGKPLPGVRHVVHNAPPSQQHHTGHFASSNGGPPPEAAWGSPAPPDASFASPPPQQHQAVEFDHAISYVTTIKKRFASDPSTYHSFLEILHTYQKEQRGIKEVLEQVAHLFQDHPDLLKEFTFFLPDAVQEQAKERLHRAAAESESRLAALRPMSSDVAATKRPRSGLAAPPESYVYNSAVERQFFDAARESLTSYSRDSGQAWAEFVKCLDLYAQEILSRQEMLNFVEPLLGKRNSNLFEEFKRILASAGSPALSTQWMEDAWYSVPLAEIDFGRCRRCTPSYRALPRDYPPPPCSERSETEVKILNDIWVSLPVGSEESYTFRHMRRNTYEETLFRVEDERFEIDMVIDSNAATLQRLEPILTEMAQLAAQEESVVDVGKVEGGGGGKRFQYTLDKKLLGVIHRNTIARIYGDHGPEMLDLLVRNPTVAVPLVVQRLRQKDGEWRTVRDRLNKHWKELAEHNYYKSLDHRSLTWRTTDKRAISARTLIAEIKDRAANHGRESKEAYRQKLDKAKEERGTYFEVTVGSKLTYELDLTFLPKPDRRLFTPHLTLNYKNVSWAQRDAYRILAFALERGTISPADKERCHRLWVEFLGPWFDLSFNWMQKPAVTYQESTRAPITGTDVRPASATVVSEDDEESLEDDPELVSHMVTEELPPELPATDVTKGMEFMDHHPLPAGAHVSTLYGEGRILEFRRSDHIYSVRLGFGATGYLRPATVLCSVLPVEKSAYTRELRAEDRTKLARPNDQLAFGTQSLYLFFRLQEILVQRLNTAKRLAYSVGDDITLQSMVEQMPNANPKAVGRKRYEAYLSLVYALLDGGVGGAAEGGKYEDRVRSLLGHHGYELATMDKLIAHIWKDMQTMANDETMWSLIQLYRRHKLAGSFQPEAFRQEAAYLSDGEPMYAFQHCPVSSSDETVLHIEYLGIMDDDDDDENMEEDVEPVVEAPVNKRPKR